jgi:hypothetical protein
MALSLRDYVSQEPYTPENLNDVLFMLGFGLPCFAVQGVEEAQYNPEAGERLWERLKLEAPLLDAAWEGDIGAMRAAIAAGARDLDGALYRTADKGHVLATAYLLDAGANPNACLGSGQPLHWALVSGQEGTVQLLLERGARLPQADECLAWAASWSGIETLRLVTNLAVDLSHPG